MGVNCSGVKASVSWPAVANGTIKRAEIKAAGPRRRPDREEKYLGDIGILGERLSGLKRPRIYVARCLFRESLPRELGGSHRAFQGKRFRSVPIRFALI